MKKSEYGRNHSHKDNSFNYLINYLFLIVLIKNSINKIKVIS